MTTHPEAPPSSAEICRLMGVPDSAGRAAVDNHVSDEYRCLFAAYPTDDLGRLDVECHPLIPGAGFTYGTCEPVGTLTLVSGGRWRAECAGQVIPDPWFGDPDHGSVQRALWCMMAVTRAVT